MGHLNRLTVHLNLHIIPQHLPMVPLNLLMMPHNLPVVSLHHLMMPQILHMPKNLDIVLLNLLTVPQSLLMVPQNQLTLPHNLLAMLHHNLQQHTLPLLILRQHLLSLLLPHLLHLLPTLYLLLHTAVPTPHKPHYPTLHSMLCMLLPTSLVRLACSATYLSSQGSMCCAMLPQVFIMSP